jgi:hypothetical protein
LGLRPNQTVDAAIWQILDVNLFRRFLLTRDEFWHETGAIGSSMKLCIQPYIERPNRLCMRPGRPIYCALLLDSELDSNLNCFWPPPRALEPDQPWTSFLTWKPLLDFFYSIPCTNRGHMHECHVLIGLEKLIGRGSSQGRGSTAAEQGAEGRGAHHLRRRGGSVFKVGSHCYATLLRAQRLTGAAAAYGGAASRAARAVPAGARVGGATRGGHGRSWHPGVRARLGRRYT